MATHQAGAADGARQERRSSSATRIDRTSERGAEQQDAIARLTGLALHTTENLVYALTALLLAAGAFVVLADSVYRLVTKVPHGVTTAMEATLNSLLVVFILVELLTAVRSAIREHLLVAEPFLLVGILAVIKEMVVLATFHLDRQRPTDAALRMAVLTVAVIGLAVATLVLRRREREPPETGD